MKTTYNRSLDAILTIDSDERVRCVLPLRPEGSGKRNPRAAAEAFIRGAAEVVRFAPAGRERMQRRVSFLEPREQGVEYHLAKEKPLFDLTTVGWWQTALNTPVWDAGVSATVKQRAHRVVGAVDNSRDNVEAKLPSPYAIERYRRLFEAGAPPDGRWRSTAPPPAATAAEASSFLAGLLRLDAGRAEPDAAPRLIRGRFFIYRYVADERTSAPEAGHQEEPPQPHGHAPTLPLPPVPEEVAEGRDYLVAEITFTLPVEGFARLAWRMMVEVESGAVLYLRALVAGMNGYVFLADPITSSGDPGKGPTQPDAVLDPERDEVLFDNLDGSGYLSGPYAAVSDLSAPFISPPAAGNLYFSARTDEFAAVNAYYHTDRFFRMVEDFGISVPIYFSHTAFPVPVDHRSGLGGPATSIGALCYGSGTNGIQQVEFALAHPNVQNGPMGAACDWRVVLHELGGHGVLYEHVESSSFLFAHSAGDSFAVILNDPESAWHTNQQIDRFLVAPFFPASNRRCDRNPAVGGWGWGGAQDDSKANKLSEKRSSEEMLSTCLFRIYRAIGGDSQDLSRRWFAARMCAYLLLSAINTLSQGTNPDTPETFTAAMLTADTGDWVLEGLFGGAYGKVIRWSFEVQGAFTDLTYMNAFGIGRGTPPEVDVYIDDGRAGEYSYRPVYWNTTAIWNRRSPDGGTTHQEPRLGVTNYAYVKVRNRGTVDAQNVVVRGFHCEPSMGMLWPDQFQPLATQQLTVSSVPASYGNIVTPIPEVLVGPFLWTPLAHAGGQDCLVMIVSEAADPSNADLFTGGPAGSSIQDWRLIPHDNNIAMRKVFPVAKWKLTLPGYLYSWASNTNGLAVGMVFRVRMPELMERRGWKIDFEGDGAEFRIEPRERRRVTLRVTPGEAFTDADIEAASDRDIVVTAHADGGLIGGMTYRLEPEAARGSDGPRPWWEKWMRWFLSRLKRIAGALRSRG